MSSGRAKQKWAALRLPQSPGEAWPGVRRRLPFGAAVGLNQRPSALKAAQPASVLACMSGLA